MRCEPWMLTNLSNSDSLHGINNEHPRNQILCWSTRTQRKSVHPCLEEVGVSGGGIDSNDKCIFKIRCLILSLTLSFRADLGYFHHQKEACHKEEHKEWHRNSKHQPQGLHNVHEKEPEQRKYQTDIEETHKNSIFDALNQHYGSASIIHNDGSNSIPRGQHSWGFHNKSSKDGHHAWRYSSQNLLFWHCAWNPAASSLASDHDELSCFCGSTLHQIWSVSTKI